MRLEPEFRALMPRLTKDEYSKLEQSIIVEGCRDALVVWDDILIDGYNRHKICTKHDIPFQITEINHFESREAVISWIIDNQLGRRNLTIEQKHYLIGKKYKEQKQAIGRPKGKSSKNELNGKASEQLSQQYKVSVGTVVNAEKFADAVDIISENIGDEVRDEILARELDVTFKDIQILAKQSVDMQKIAIAEMRNGKSMGEAIQTFKQLQRDLEIDALKSKIHDGIDLPRGVFEVVVIDPPWPYGTQYDPDTRRAASPYPEMTLEQIRDEPYPFAADCICWLWTTHKFMHDAFHLIEAWKFRDVAIVTWVKDSIGLGSWLRSQSEFCIMAVKGKPVVDLSNQSTVVITAPVTIHSEKPDVFYEMVDSLCIGRKLDYYNRKQRNGWAEYGTKELE